MSIEQGLVMLVQDNSDVQALCSAGGFLGQLPANQALPSWTHDTITQQTDYLLSGRDSLVVRRVQLDCYGNTAAEAIQLAAAIDAVLNGYRGTLSDPDSTVVAGCFQSNLIDFFDDASRTYRRLLEYMLWFQQS